MLHLFPSAGGVNARLTRRHWLAMMGMATGSLATLIHSGRLLAGPSSRRPTATRCIYIFLCGGPSQPDLWDLKPEAPSGVRSEFKSIPTSVPGTHFGELIPQVARHADKLA